jgi:glycosyltransferase involved in cell wall biosynthesis
MPFFSIVIPLYNKEKSIANTLKSVLVQTFTDFEIIIINDGSTDTVLEVVKNIIDNRTTLITTKNQGVSAARNLGIENSNGEVIAFLDADDYWYPNHLEQLVMLYKKYPNCGLYATNYEIFYNSKKIVTNSFIDIPNEPWHGIVTDFFKSSLVSRIALTSALAIKKTVLLDCNKFDTDINFGEDLELWIRIARSRKVAFCNMISVRYFIDAPNRLSDSNIQNRKFAKLNQFLNEESNNPTMKCFLDMYRADFAIKHKMENDFPTFLFYKNQIDLNNLSLKTRLILKLPTPILKVLYAFKKYLERKNILISIYH